MNYITSFPLLAILIYISSKDSANFQAVNFRLSAQKDQSFGNIQRFLCSNCKRIFSVNIGFEKMKHNPQAVTTAMQLYFSGESL
jgi:hypothetical protein